MNNNTNNKSHKKTTSSSVRKFSNRRLSKFNTNNRFRKNNTNKSFGRNNSKRGKLNKRFERIDVSKFINKSTSIEKDEVYVSENTFNDFKIDERLKCTIAKKNYICPSPIQDKSIPHTLLGKDMLGIADTGTGKTAAFLIPIINKIIKDKKETAIIIAPTRELAIQIEKEFIDLSCGMKIYSSICVGGTPIFPQIRNLRRGCNLVIGTPGRLLDLVKRGEIDLSQTRTVVLDEADRMLDMGFIDDITLLLEKTSKERQGFFFSATLPKEVEKLIERFSNNPIKIMVKKRDTSKNVEQDIIRVKDKENKIEVLSSLLDNSDEFKKVLIFSETKHAVEKLSLELIKRGFKAGSIHGDKRHNDRQKTLKLFKEDQIHILVATDVAARGLDIPNVTHVINYEIPQTYDTYIHRIGRTGRANHKGIALTFV